MKMHLKIFRTTFLLMTIIFSTLIFTGAYSDNPLQYKLVFKEQEKTINCIKSSNGILLVPLKDVAEFVGYTVEECGRCGKDEVYDSKDNSKNQKGRIYINWNTNIITYSNDSSIIALDANTERKDGIVTYTSLQLYNNIGITPVLNESDRTIKFTMENTSLSTPNITEQKAEEKSENKEVEKVIDSSEDKQVENFDNSIGNKQAEKIEDNIGEKEAQNPLVSSDDKIKLLNKIVYAYDPNCSTCKEITTLLDSFKNKEGIKIEEIDATNTQNTKIINELNSKTNVPEDIREIYPIIYIGNQYLFDVEITEANIKTLLNNEIFKHNFKNETSVKPDNSKQLVNDDSVGEKKILIYFYSSTCASCKKAENFISDLNKNNSNITLISYNILDYENLKLLEEYEAKYNLAEKDLGNIPAIFISNTALIGDKEIISKLDDELKKYDLNNPTVIIDENNVEEKNSIENDRVVQFVTVLSAGIVNGINPCSLSMFLFLLSIMIVDRKKILKIGLSFCLGKFTMFFLLGTLFYKAISLIDINFINIVTKIFLAIFIIIFVFLNLNDFIEAKMEKYDKIILQLPGKLRKVYHTFMKKTVKYTSSKYLIVIMVFLGMFLALGEFLCTGQIYLTSIIFMIQSRSTGFISIMYLLLYSFAFVIPLIAMTLLVYSGKKVFNLSNLLLEKLPLIKVISALIFVVFGIYIIFLT